MDINKIKTSVVEWIKNWFAENGSGCNAIVGISGGKDSSVVAALCVEALGKNRVIGVLMPNGIQLDIEDSIEVVEHLGIPFTELNIEKSYNAILDSIDNLYTLQSDYSRIGNPFIISEQTKINLAPRIRMSALYAISQSMNGRVANTCNLSENWVGYSTRFGDDAGDFSPLGALTAHEVVALGDLLHLPYDLVHKVPSDGLCGKTDEDNLGFTYEVLDKYIRTGECANKDVREKIDSMHIKNAFKLKPIPYFIP